MQIGIDARAALWYRGSGIGTYTYRLIRELLSIDPLNEYQLVYPPAKWIEVRDGFRLAEGKGRTEASGRKCRSSLIGTGWIWTFTTIPITA